VEDGEAVAGAVVDLVVEAVVEDLEGSVADQAAVAAPRVAGRKKKEWSVYILLCENGTFYTGIAKNVQTRFENHQKGRGAAYTRMHKPLRILYTESRFTQGDALKRERAIKTLPRKKKMELIY
jgi:putative endonuclease